jgi:arabinogalactan endo-1,4-beta-galactosidase
VVLSTRGAGAEWSHFDDVELVPGAARLSLLGADISGWNKSEDPSHQAKPAAWEGSMQRSSRGRFTITRSTSAAAYARRAFYPRPSRSGTTARGVPFDVIGLSFYPYWHGSLGDLQRNLNDVSARYAKDVVVVETGYPFTLADADGHPNLIGLEEQLVPGYSATPEGQAAFVRDLLAIVRAVPARRGLGVFYWDATWLALAGNGWDPSDPASGNAWENQALFDFRGRPLPALSVFQP